MSLSYSVKLSADLFHTCVVKVKEFETDILELLSKHMNLWNGYLGTIKVTNYTFDLKEGTHLIRQQLYCVERKSLEVLCEHTDQQLKADVVKSAQSEWGSLFVLVPLKNGTFKFCVDYRKFDAAAIPDIYSLPLMDDCIESLEGIQVFTAFDALWRYRPVPIKWKDKNKTTFTSHLGTCCYTCSSFDLRNTPATFPHKLNIILSEVWSKMCFVYIDDLVMSSKNNCQHDNDIDKVLSLLHQTVVPINLSKCQLFQEKIEYLGHIVMHGRLAAASKNADTIETAVVVTGNTKTKLFLGVCNTYKSFIKDLSRIAPLNDYLQNKNKNKKKNSD